MARLAGVGISMQRGLFQKSFLKSESGSMGLCLRGRKC